MRPLQCRTFPLTPHLTEDGILLLIYNDEELPYICPLIEKINVRVSVDYEGPFTEEDMETLMAVSYTHLDVYKRQIYNSFYSVTRRQLRREGLILDSLHTLKVE